VFAENLTRMRSLLFSVIERMPTERKCPCPAALDGLELPFELP
jgi:5'-methylthioadenosine phosphorylase